MAHQQWPPYAGPVGTSCQTDSSTAWRAISAKTVTYAFHRMMQAATKLKCSEFGDAIIKHME